MSACVTFYKRKVSVNPLHYSSDRQFYVYTCMCVCICESDISARESGFTFMTNVSVALFISSLTDF